MLIKDYLDIAMFLVLVGALLMGFPVAFTLGGVSIIFAFIGNALGVFDLSFLSFLPQRIFGTMTNETLVAVPLFVFMGVVLERSKVAEELLETMGLLFGRLRGGLGISVSVVGALLAASTGIVGATVVTMGLIALPTMLKRGYDPRLATGGIAAAGTLGQIIPPSIVLVLLGDVMGSAYQQAQLKMGIFSPDTVSVGDLFAGALIPGLMLVGIYILYQVFAGIINPAGSPALSEEEVAAGRGPGFGKRIFSALVPPLVLIIAVLGSILGGLATPTEAAAVGAVGSLMLGAARHPDRSPIPIYISGAALIAILVLTGLMDLRFQRSVISTAENIGIIVAAILLVLIAWGLIISILRAARTSMLNEVMRGTARVSSMVFVILIGAAAFSLVFRGLGGDDLVHELLTGMPGGTFGALMIVMIVMFIMGFFLDFIEITFVVVPLVAPVLLQLDVNPVWLGVMMAMNLQTSFLTPPFGFALFYLRGVAPPSVKTWDIYKGVIPFVLIQIVALAILWIFPGITTFLPDLLYR
ncbi:TRAP transporter large permease subunit [Tistrella mobilis]|uniref:TRAP transporter large permease n=1 Tax=Tistrella mobilis TaxID=171437 RepID=UPI0031F60484